MEAASSILQMSWYRYTRARYGTAGGFFSWHPCTIILRRKGGTNPRLSCVSISWVYLFAVVALSTLKIR